MDKPLNFEDNIFIINTRIRMIRDLLLLDADPDFFLEKTLDDVDFINTTLTVMLDHLVHNERYIERDEQFHNLTETERRFTEILGELLNGEGSISAARFPIIRDRIALLRNHSLDRRNTIDNLADTHQADQAVTTAVVSPDELSELLRELK
jgi:hypothetical protein